MKKILIILIFFLCLSPVSILFAQQIDLKSAVDAKAEELKEVHRQIQETQEQLLAAEKKKASLGREIKKTNYAINQLDLSIKSNVINIEKLGLEIESLDLSIGDTQEKIERKTAAINQILRELQIKGDESLVEIILKNNSLADSMNEVQGLSELKKQLTRDIDDLKGLKRASSDQLTQVSRKKIAVERDYKASQVKKTLRKEEKIEREQLLALTKGQEFAFQKQLEDLAERQIKIAEEIEEIEAALRRQINQSSLPPARPGTLSWPIENGYRLISQGYGATAFARYGYRGKWHNGIDIASPLGTPILAPANGLVLNIGDQDQFCRKGAYGKYAVVRHNNGLTTLYAHLSSIDVSPGDQINRGEVIGYIGSTGYSTGPHLHFTVYESGTFKMSQSRTCGLMPSGGDIDPNEYL